MGRVCCVAKKWPLGPNLLRGGLLPLFEPAQRFLSIELAPEIEELLAAATHGAVLGLQQLVRGQQERAVIGMQGEVSLQLAGRDDGVLMLAQDVLDAGRQTDESPGLLARALA